MSLLTQVIVAEKYGLRLDMEQLGEALSIAPKTIYNRVSAGDFPVKTYVDGGKRWADHRDVAEHFDTMRAQAS